MGYKNKDWGYGSAKDVNMLEIPRLHPIEIDVCLGATVNGKRGNSLNRVVGYFDCVLERGTGNDAVSYFREILDGNPLERRTIMLPLIGEIRPLKRE